MDSKVSDRRGEPRLSGVTVPISRVTLRPGSAVHIVDISQAGAQIQTDRPLRPGSHVQLRLVTPDQTIVLAAVVLRCAVWALYPFRGVRYRGSLRFEERCEAFWEEPVLATTRWSQRIVD